MAIDENTSELVDVFFNKIFPRRCEAICGTGGCNWYPPPPCSSWQIWFPWHFLQGQPPLFFCYKILCWWKSWRWCWMLMGLFSTIGRCFVNGGWFLVLFIEVISRTRSTGTTLLIGERSVERVERWYSDAKIGKCKNWNSHKMIKKQILTQW